MPGSRKKKRKRRRQSVDDRTSKPRETTTTTKRTQKATTTQAKADTKKAERRKQGVSKLEPKQFAQRIVKKDERGRLELVEKFRRFKAQQVEETRRQKRSAFDANSGKNRFTDVVCGDKERIILKDRLPGDYIHANFVKLFKEKLAICAQGPKESTALDFWRMIWQEDSKIIVMLCNFEEENRNKCFQYFAEDLNKEMEFPPFKITTNGSSLKLLDLIATKRQEIDGKEPKKPWSVTIDCSAGIGRTGTLVTLDMCSDILDSEGKVADVASVVRNIRRQRLVNMKTVTEAYKKM